MRIHALAILLGATLAAGSAHAQGQQPSSGQQVTPEQRFQELDGNHDGRLTKQEFMAVVEQRWLMMLNRHDANKDGIISKDEFTTPPKGSPQGGQPPRQ